MKVLIIEDEKKAARQLIDILAEIDDTIEIQAVVESVTQGIKWFKEHESPDLIFSDIQLNDGLSFLIFQEINVKSPIVFCTAFDEYLMDAFDTHAISYLLKPISKELLERALEKLREMQTLFQKQTSANGIDNLLAQLNYHYKTTLLVNQGERIIPLKIADIACFYLDGSAVTIITSKNQHYHHVTTLDELQKMLNPSLFYRAYRQFIINRNAIIGAERYFSRKLIAKLSVEVPEKIVVSKVKSSEFLEWLGGE